MFVPHARVHISAQPHKRNSKARQARLTRRRVGAREFLRMPCLMPTIFVVFLGLLVLAGGAGMCVLGYIPDTPDVTSLHHDFGNDLYSYNPDSTNNQNNNNNNHDKSNGSAHAADGPIPKDARYYATKSMSYVGPILMGCGFFAIIVACVLYCEIVDRYAALMPSKPDASLKRQDLLEMIIGEFKKSYFRGIEVPLKKDEPPPQKGKERQMETLLKALSISTPVLLMSPDLAPSWHLSHYPYPYRYTGHRHHKPRHPKLKQLGCSGSSGGGGHEPWLKTSSLPNIHDPELRRHNLARPVPLPLDPQHGAASGAAVGPEGAVGSRARRARRFGRASRSMDSRISWSLPQTLSRSTSGVDNPAYLHEQDRKKSVSMCVHAASGGYSADLLRRPHGARFIKASQLQPRIRLQQQQHQQIQHKQQQQQLQQQNKQLLQQPQNEKPEQRQKQQKKVVRQHSSRESDEGYDRRRSDSDGAKPRHRPKLVRTKGAHKSFDSSGDSSFASLMPSEPPPFPLPAHFMHTQLQQQQQHMQQQQQHTFDTLQVVSPRTAKLLKAKCKSEDVRDKKKPDVMLLKDLFRSVDMPDPPPPHPSLVSQTSSSSMPCTAVASSYLDPLAGKQCESVRVICHSLDQDSPARPLIGKTDSAFVSVSPSNLRTDADKDKSAYMSGSVADSTASNNSKEAVKPEDDQRYELPLLSGVARSNRQWEAERRRRVSTSDARQPEKSHSLDAKDPKSYSSRLEAKKSEIHRAHSFNVPLGQPSGKSAQTKHSSTSKPSHDKEKSNLLRVISPSQQKARSRSWDGDKSQSLDTPTTCHSSSHAPTLAVPRIERASSFDPVTTTARDRSRDTSRGPEFVRSGSPYPPCMMVFESETPPMARRQSEDIHRHQNPCLTLPVPILPQRVQTSPDRSAGDAVAGVQQQQQQQQKQQRTNVQYQTQHPSRPQQLPVPTHDLRVQEPRQVLSPRHLSPSRADSAQDHRKLLSPSSPRHLSPTRADSAPHEYRQSPSPRHLCPSPADQPVPRTPSPRHLSPPSTEPFSHHDRRQTPSPRLRSPTPGKQIFIPNAQSPRTQSPRALSPLATTPTTSAPQERQQSPVRPFAEKPSQASARDQQLTRSESEHGSYQQQQQRHSSVLEGSLRETQKHHGASGLKTTMRHSQTEQQLSDLQQKRSVIVHQASVHLSLDSFPAESSAPPGAAIAASSAFGGADVNTSPSVPLLLSSPPGTPPCVAGGSSYSLRDEGGGGAGGGGDKSGGGGGGKELSAHALKRAQYTQSRSVAIEESSPDDDTEDTPLIHNPNVAHGSGTSPKS